MELGVEAAVCLPAVPPTRTGKSISPDGAALNWVASAIQTLEDSNLHLKQSMENYYCSKDSIRRVMLKHEKIFKEQVRELHRLYGVQKALMSELSTQLGAQQATAAASMDLSDTRSSFMQQSPASMEQSSSASRPRVDGDSLEFPPKRGLFHLELRGKEIAGSSFASTDSRRVDSEDSSLELSLGIGDSGGARSSRQKPCLDHGLWTGVQNSGQQLVMQEGRKGGAHDARLAGQRPGWLFQSLGPSGK